LRYIYDIIKFCGSQDVLALRSAGWSEFGLRRARFGFRSRAVARLRQAKPARSALPSKSLCGDVSACGIVALRRQVLGLAGALVALAPNHHRLSALRRHRRRLRQPLMRVGKRPPGLETAPVANV
jgi:hypothetical protein